MTALLVVTWNNAALTNACFASLERTLAHRDDVTLFWLDNGSDRRSLASVKRELVKNVKHLPVEAFFLDGNAGFVKGTNYLWREANKQGFDQVVLLNNDTELPAGWLERLEAAADKKFDIVGPVQSAGFGWQAINNLQERLPHIFLEQVRISDVRLWERADDRLRTGLPGYVYPVNSMIAFFCTLIRRPVWEKIGYLDEAYGIGMGDDDDYCLKAREAGFRMGMACDVLVYHHHRATFKLLKKRTGFDFEKHQVAAIDLYKKRNSLR